jgi:tetratricopeptide (TPR) repeat protein
MFERASRLKPDYENAKANLAWAKNSGGTPRFTQAFQLQSAGRNADAIAIYRDLIKENPGWVNAHYNLGYALMMMNNCAEAMTEFERVLALQPDYPVAHLHLSTCLGKMGRRADSVTHRAIYDRSLQSPAANR